MVVVVIVVRGGSGSGGGGGSGSVNRWKPSSEAHQYNNVDQSQSQLIFRLSTY